MPRNLDHRVEIVVPIESQRAQAELNTIFDTLLADNRQAWQLGADGAWTRLQPADGREAEGRPDRADAPRPAARAPPGRVPQPCPLGRSSAGWFVRPVRAGTIEPMRVAVIDVGSNTARLLVAEQGRRGTERIGEAKAYLGLGAEIIRHGHVGAEKLSETAEETRRFAAIARELDAEEIDVFVTAPARQAANADLLVATIARATGHFVRVLSAKEEGELAYEGAIATTSVGSGPGRRVRRRRRLDRDHGRRPQARLVLVGLDRPRLAAAHGDGAARRPADGRAARRGGGARGRPARIGRPPQVETALAVGGSARSLAKLAGRRLDEATLTDALERSSRSRPRSSPARSRSTRRARRRSPAARSSCAS